MRPQPVKCFKVFLTGPLFYFVCEYNKGSDKNAPM